MQSKGRTVLVTGGAGFVGSHCVVKLLEDGYQVVVVDNLINSWRGKDKIWPECLVRCEILAGKRLYFYPVDIGKADALSEVFEKHTINCVMHFAALKSVTESCKNPLQYYTNNITGTMVLIEVMQKYGVHNIVYSSSSTVYGNPQYLPLDECHPTGIGCTNPYGKSKYFVEEIFKDICVSNKEWKVISLRYFNPVGAHESGQIGEDPCGIPNNLMPYIAQVAVGRRPNLFVYGNDYDTPDGTGIRDYIHIQDLAQGHLAALKKIFSSFDGFKAYNLGTGRGYSVLEVVKMFEVICGHKIPLKIDSRREGDVASSYCDATLAQQELGWMATRDLNDMCRDMWRWQQKNPNGYSHPAHS